MNWFCGFGWFKFWFAKKLFGFPRLIFLKQSLWLKLDYPVDKTDLILHFACLLFGTAKTPVLIVKVTFGMFELTAPYSRIVVSMVVMERVTRAGTAERLIQKQHQLRITRTTAGM